MIRRARGAAGSVVERSPTSGGSTSPVIVVGVDGSDSGRFALRAAATRAALVDGRVVAVHVPPPMPMCWSWAIQTVSQLGPWREQLEAEAFFDTSFAADQAGVRWSFEVSHGDVASALRTAAKVHQASLLVVAAGVRHRWPHLCPALRLAAGRDCPVLVAGTGARPAEVG